MARFRYAVVLEPIPRGWFDEHVGLGHDILAEYLGGEDLPLAGGEHLSPGAWYSSPDERMKITVDSWHRQGETACGMHLDEDDTLMIMSLRLVGASAPRTAEFAMDTRTDVPYVSWLTAMTSHARVDLERWWAAAARDGGAPAIEGWVKPAMVRAVFAVTPAPARGGRWRVTVRANVRGRGLLAPLTALALLIFRFRVRRVFREALDKFAERWNGEVPALLATSPDELRERVMTELAKRP